MFSINEKIIKDLATNDRVYKKGLAYYRANRVADIKADMEELCFSAIVMGDSDEYETEVYFTSDGGIFSIECGCPAFSRYEGACKHVVALLKGCQEVNKLNTRTLKIVDGLRENQVADNILDFFEYSLNRSDKKPVNLEITLEISLGMGSFLMYRHLNFLPLGKPS